MNPGIRSSYIYMHMWLLQSCSISYVPWLLIKDLVLKLNEVKSLIKVNVGCVCVCVRVRVRVRVCSNMCNSVATCKEVPHTHLFSL